MIGAALAALVLAGIAAGCHGHSAASVPSVSSDHHGDVFPQGGNGVAERTRIGRGEGRLDLVAWHGYLDPGLIRPFQSETGCAVHITPAPGAGRITALLASGRYDGVLAAGDAATQLIHSKLVAPLDTSLVQGYGQIQPKLQSPAFDTTNGVNYGIAYQWAANLLLYNTKLVKPAPTSWSVVFNGHSYRGNVTAYDSPISIAEAALYLKTHEAALGIGDPYELTRPQFEAAVGLMQAQRSQVGHYWSTAAGEVHDFEDGRVVIGTGWPGQAAALAAEREPVLAVVPGEGMTGWADAWMMAAHAAHPNCMLRWLQYTATPIAQAETALVFGTAPANPQACGYADGLQPGFCQSHHVTDSTYLGAVFWKTPVADCGNGKTNCVPYADWVQAWTLIKG